MKDFPQEEENQRISMSQMKMFWKSDGVQESNSAPSGGGEARNK